MIEGYLGQKLVRKTFKPDSGIAFGSIEDVRAAIDKERKGKKLAQELVVSKGISPDQVPQSDYVIHADEGGNVTFTEFQALHPDSRNLSELKLSVLRLPSDSLRQLDRAFDAAGDFARSRGNILDLTGSSTKKYFSFQKN